jgi:hypothetical protein
MHRRGGNASPGLDCGNRNAACGFDGGHCQLSCGFHGKTAAHQNNQAKTAK